MYIRHRFRDRISSLCDHIRRHFLGHNRANDERLLGTINREGASAGKASLHSGPLPVNTFLLTKIWYTARSCRPQTYTHNNWQPPLHGISAEEQSSECPYQHYNDQNRWKDGRCRILQRNVRRYSYTVCTCKANGMER